MWRRIANSVRSFVRNSPSPASEVIVMPPVANVDASRAGQPVLNDEAKMAAYKQLREAVKDLSDGQSQSITSPSPATLKKWVTLPIAELSVDQLEELARVYFEGNCGMPKDDNKAMELWTIAADKGSVQAKYSKAMCIKEGSGIAKNVKQAFEELERLANSENFNFAHVSSDHAFNHYE